uniref:LOW QUALITY PROTEIN: arf-GAP with Rho-GAP domain, ANK repeat and PH domain-containing protein 3 n=1 Tax=Euleptes europaea TaxID=460621 RepID=UPI002540F1BE|nr:LOW QUALITY PROTEIN: arf-GAP with Rho-GAP domain, ANK repeat and PH domain-containing protein 3 [Euleptes europaea]
MSMLMACQRRRGSRSIAERGGEGRPGRGELPSEGRARLARDRPSGVRREAARPQLLLVPGPCPAPLSVGGGPRAAETAWGKERTPPFQTRYGRLKRHFSSCQEDMRPQFCVNSDIADWLASIHLERYLDAFKQLGYRSVRDVISLEKEDLQKLGVTATGHRKRILNLVEQTQLLAGDRNWHMAGDVRYKASKCADSPDGPKPKNGTGGSKEISAELVSGLVIEHDVVDRSQPLPPDSDLVALVAKPVPKPRTVFPRSCQGVKLEHDSAAPARASLPVSKTTSGSQPAPATCVLEGFDPGERTADAEGPQAGLGDQIPELPLPPQSGPRGENVGPSLQASAPPNERSHQVECQPGASFSSPLTCFPYASQPTGSCPAEPVPAAATVLREPLVVQAAVIRAASPQGRTERVPGGPGDGADLLPSPAASMGAKEPPRNCLNVPSADTATENRTLDGERASFLGQPCLGLHHVSQALVNRTDPVEELISPYCEGMFGHSWSCQEQEYEELPECVPSQGGGGREGEGHLNGSRGTEEMNPATQSGASHTAHSETEGYSTVEAPQSRSSPLGLSNHLHMDEALDDLTISPYASYTSLSERPATVLSGWLDKLSPQGNYVFQRRFVRFDGKNLMYFNNEKEPYPKGLVPLSIIEMARCTKDNKLQVVTSHRIFVFRAESEAQRNIWCSTLQQKVTEQRLLSPRPPLSSGGKPLQKSGYLELKGYKSKVFVALILSELWLYKSEQFFKIGIAICLIEMQGSTIREAKGRSFELITPLKIFSFGAESEREKREWMEALQNSIAEMLYDYEVAEKIWSNKANRFCADCSALNPDWASVNLCVVICKQCAGQHRSLGSSISKVQSLKLDTGVWSNEMVQLFIVLGNEQVNRFWAARLLPSEALYPDASTEQRRDFIIHKYRYGHYRSPHPQYSSQEHLLQALCAAVSGPGLLKTMLQFFAASPESEAGSYEAVLETGRDQRQSGPGGVEELNLEGVYNEVTQPVAQCGYLYKAPAMTKLAAAKKSREEFQRVWCSLEKCLLVYESDRSLEPLGKVEMEEVMSLGVNRIYAPASPGSSDRFPFTLELYLSSDRVQPLGADGPDTLQSWASAIGKWFTPLCCHCLLSYEFQRVGRLSYKSMLNPDQWLQGFFVLQKSHLFICPKEGEGATEDSINLRQLQELSVVPLAEDPEKKEMLVLVEMGRTFHLQGASRLDFSAWCVAIQASAGGQGNALRDQQLSRSGIPIIVNSCIAFITQYGLRHEGVYRKNGAKSRIKALMEEFRRDARNVKLRISDNFIEDVTDVLKRFFRELEDPVFTLHLHPQWQEAAEIPEKPRRLEQYKKLISYLPHVNHRTLAALIGHLYRVQKCADLNQMNTKNLALLFAPSLFQTDGKGEHEVKVMEDLIDNYVHIFNIDEDRVSQMDLENSLITTWRDVQLSQAGDLILEAYLEQKNPDRCVTLKVSPVMTAEELTNQVLEMRNVAASMDLWLTFEVLENGELERPLHPKEKVLEQALQWCKLPKPGSAYLLVKKVPIKEGSCLFTGAKRESPKCGLLKCREDPPRLLGSKFQERYFVIKDRKLLLLKEKRSARPEREWLLDLAKVYMGVRKKLKPPSQWSFTLILEKQHLYLACTGQSELWDWTTSILKAQHDGLRPVILRRHSSSDLAKQKFGTMPLIPLRGDSTNPIMLSANQTLRRLHTRRTLSMFFPMKMHQDSLEEQQEAAEPEPVYEEVGSFPSGGFLELSPSLLPPVDRTKKPPPCSEPAPPSSLPPCPAPRASGTNSAKALSLERGLWLEPDKATMISRLPRHRGATHSSPAERTAEPPQRVPAPSREQEQPPGVPVLPPETPSAPGAHVGETRKKKVSLSDKLIEELSTAIFQKNDGQASLPLGPQGFSSAAGDQAQLQGSGPT